MPDQEKPKPPQTPDIDDLLAGISAERPPERLRDLRIALEIVGQQAKILREQITTELQRLGLPPPEQSKPEGRSSDS